MIDNMNLTVVPALKSVSGNGATRVYPAGVTCAEDSWRDAAELFERDLCAVRGVAPDKGAGIWLEKDAGLTAGAYSLSIGERVTVRAADIAGINHGMATLLQLSRGDSGALVLPEVEIADSPDKEYRGFMIDLARQWHSFDELLKLVDMCWLYKAGPLHLHFMDDQSDTLPSAAFPKLALPGRCYSREQISRLVNYARARGVELMPEIEAPGHCTHFQRMYPEVFGTSGVITASEAVFAALGTLLDEVISMFPYSRLIHIGGDEANIERWLTDAESLDFMRTHGLHTMHELYTEFVARVTELVLARGRTPVVWEGFPASGDARISKEVIVFAWESMYQTAPELLSAGFKVINASWKPLYIVAPDTHWAPAELRKWNVYKWEHWWVKSQAYHNDIVVPPTEQVIGGQLCAWGDGLGEYGDLKRAEADEFARIRERFPVVADRTWNADTPIVEASYSARQAVDDILSVMISYNK